MISFSGKLRNKIPTDTFTESELAVLTQGTDHSKYGRVKRALHSGELLQLRRGAYVFGSQYRRQPLNLFEVAQTLYSLSYISTESALSFHQWIPEATYTVTSVCSKRSASFTTSIGSFSYTRISRFNFLGVDRIVQGNSIFFMASPTKALVDYVWVHKIDLGLIDLAQSLRIEEDSLKQISRELLRQLEMVYHNQRVTRFIRKATKELWL